MLGLFLDPAYNRCLGYSLSRGAGLHALLQGRALTVSEDPSFFIEMPDLTGLLIYSYGPKGADLAIKMRVRGIPVITIDAVLDASVPAVLNACEDCFHRLTDLPRLPVSERWVDGFRKMCRWWAMTISFFVKTMIRLFRIRP